MLKYSLYTIKNNTAEKSLIFRGRAHTQKDSRQQTLNLSSSEPPSTCICRKFCLLIILKYKNEDIMQ